jgi:hypothetical protein
VAVEKEVSTRENALPLDQQKQQKQQFVPTLQFLAGMWNQQFPITSLPPHQAPLPVPVTNWPAAVGKPLISRCGVARLESAA